MSQDKLDRFGNGYDLAYYNLSFQGT